MSVCALLPPVNLGPTRALRVTLPVWLAELLAAHLAPAPLPELPANRSPSPAVPAACSLFCCCCRAGPADVKLLLVLAWMSRLSGSMLVYCSGSSDTCGQHSTTQHSTSQHITAHMSQQISSVLLKRSMCCAGRRQLGGRHRMPCEWASFLTDCVCDTVPAAHLLISCSLIVWWRLHENHAAIRRETGQHKGMCRRQHTAA